ncbi:hypothetical protein BDV98DRAFT_560594 [Pterulicium gracile]|uniref:ABM domain-containing protein n=1 Tax=Pterulicium gracile TaxID=1884261 RepID=A0A5C3QUW6_9AGAR|nr:hypothetical protein BDV98DRAFT_560594 [Pterula gracilis]
MAPPIPYYAVIFYSLRTPAASSEAYASTAARMVKLAEKQPGFIGIESVSTGETGMTVSYWETLQSISAWKRNLEHLGTQKRGRREWYAGYHIRIAKVEREYARGMEGRHRSEQEEFTVIKTGRKAGKLGEKAVSHL